MLVFTSRMQVIQVIAATGVYRCEWPVLRGALVRRSTEVVTSIERELAGLSPVGINTSLTHARPALAAAAKTPDAAAALSSASFVAGGSPLAGIALAGVETGANGDASSTVGAGLPPSPLEQVAAEVAASRSRHTPPAVLPEDEEMDGQQDGVVASAFDVQPVEVAAAAPLAPSAAPTDSGKAAVAAQDTASATAPAVADTMVTDTAASSHPASMQVDAVATSDVGVPSTTTTSSSGISGDEAQGQDEIAASAPAVAAVAVPATPDVLSTVTESAASQMPSAAGNTEESAVEVEDACQLPPAAAELLSQVVTALERFKHAAPFTLQRICEILSTPRRYYQTTSKVVHALQQCLGVSSTLQPLHESAAAAAARAANDASPPADADGVGVAAMTPAKRMKAITRARERRRITLLAPPPSPPPDHPVYTQVTPVLKPYHPHPQNRLGPREAARQRQAAAAAGKEVVEPTPAEHDGGDSSSLPSSPSSAAGGGDGGAGLPPSPVAGAGRGGGLAGRGGGAVGRGLGILNSILNPSFNAGSTAGSSPGSGAGNAAPVARRGGLGGGIGRNARGGLGGLGGLLSATSPNFRVPRPWGHQRRGLGGLDDDDDGSDEDEFGEEEVEAIEEIEDDEVEGGDAGSRQSGGSFAASSSSSSGISLGAVLSGLGRGKGLLGRGKGLLGRPPPSAPGSQRTPPGAVAAAPPLSSSPAKGDGSTLQRVLQQQLKPASTPSAAVPSTSPNSAPSFIALKPVKSLADELADDLMDDDDDSDDDDDGAGAASLQQPLLQQLPQQRQGTLSGSDTDSSSSSDDDLSSSSSSSDDDDDDGGAARGGGGSLAPGPGTSALVGGWHDVAGVDDAGDGADLDGDHSGGATRDATALQVQPPRPSTSYGLPSSSASASSSQVPVDVSHGFSLGALVRQGFGAIGSTAGGLGAGMPSSSASSMASTDVLHLGSSSALGQPAPLIAPQSSALGYNAGVQGAAGWASRGLVHYDDDDDDSLDDSDDELETGLGQHAPSTSTSSAPASSFGLFDTNAAAGIDFDGQWDALLANKATTHGHGAPSSSSSSSIDVAVGGAGASLAPQPASTSFSPGRALALDTLTQLSSSSSASSSSASMAGVAVAPPSGSSPHRFVAASATASTTVAGTAWTGPNLVTTSSASSAYHIPPNEQIDLSSPLLSGMVGGTGALHHHHHMHHQAPPPLSELVGGMLGGVGLSSGLPIGSSPSSSTGLVGGGSVGSSAALQDRDGGSGMGFMISAALPRASSLPSSSSLQAASAIADVASTTAAMSILSAATTSSISSSSSGRKRVRDGGDDGDGAGSEHGSVPAGTAAHDDDNHGAGYLLSPATGGGHRDGESAPDNSASKRGRGSDAADAAVDVSHSTASASSAGRDPAVLGQRLDLHNDFESPAGASAGNDYPAGLEQPATPGMGMVGLVALPELVGENRAIRGLWDNRSRGDSQ